MCGDKRQGESMATRNRQRSELTVSQQNHVRANLMRSASKISTQIEHYIETGEVKVAGNIIPMTPERLSTYRLVLDRTVPTLSTTEITHKTGLANMDSAQLVSKLADLVKGRPQLRAKLQEALGGRLIEGEVVTEQNPPQDKEGSVHEAQVSLTGLSGTVDGGEPTTGGQGKPADSA